MEIKYKGATAVSFGSMFLEGGLNTIITAIMVLLAAHFSEDKAAISMLIAAKGAGTVLTLYISGLLSDKYGRRNVIFIGALLFIIFVGGMMITDNYTVALVLSFIGGLAHGMMDAPGLTIMFDVYKDKAGPFLSLIQVFFGGGGMFTSFVASILISNGISYKVLFGFYLVVAVLLGILILISKYPPIEVPEAGKEFINMFEKQPRVMREGLLLGFLIFVYSCYSFVFYTWVGTYMTNIKGFTEAGGVQALLACQIGSVLGSFFFAYVLRFTHPTTIMSINAFIGAAFLILIFMVQNSFLLLALTLLSGFFLGVYFSLAISMGGELFPDKAGSASGAIGTASMLGGTIFVSLSGKIVASMGVEPVMYANVVALIIVGIIGIYFRRQYLNLGKRVFELQ